MDKKPAPPPGFYEGITYKEYDSWDAVRPTVIKQLHKDPCMELCKHIMDNPRPPGPAMIVGNAVHTLAMEPELFPSKYVFVPKTYMKAGTKKDAPEVETAWSWNANRCKDWGREQEAAGRTVIRKSQQFPRPREAVEGMAGGLMSNPESKPLLSGGMCEVCIVWRDEPSGVLCKARLDYLRRGEGGGDLIIDIKTAADIKADAISKSSYNLGYQIQAAMGWDGLDAIGRRPERYLYAFVRSKKPYLVNVVEAEENILICGRSQYKWLVKKWGECIESGVYGGYNQNGIGELYLPGWAGQELA